MIRILRSASRLVEFSLRTASAARISQNFPSLRSARLVLDFQPCSARTGDGGWPETGWETAAGRAVTRRLGVARIRSRERHRRQHRGQHHHQHHRQHPEPAARMGAFRCPCLEDFIGLPCCNLLALGSPCHLLGVPWICNLLALGSPRHLLGVPWICNLLALGSPRHLLGVPGI